MIVSCAEEFTRVSPHPSVLMNQFAMNDEPASAHPGFIIDGGFLNIHAPLSHPGEPFERPYENVELTSEGTEGWRTLDAQTSTVPNCIFEKIKGYVL